VGRDLLKTSSAHSTSAPLEPITQILQNVEVPKESILTIESLDDCIQKINNLLTSIKNIKGTLGETRNHKTATNARVQAHLAYLVVRTSLDTFLLQLDPREGQNAKDLVFSDSEDVYKDGITAIKEAEKKHSKVRVKELEEELHKKLAVFGFQENQIEAVLDPKRAERPPVANATPVYCKIHTSHLDHETLNYFAIPWEYDTVSDACLAEI
jgi:hypothetical protein